MFCKPEACKVAKEEVGGTVDKTSGMVDKPVFKFDTDDEFGAE